MLFKLEPKFLKIAMDLRTALAAVVHNLTVSGLEEQLNIEKLRMFRARTSRQTIFRA
jgi:hypothetical protein